MNLSNSPRACPREPGDDARFLRVPALTSFRAFQAISFKVADSITRLDAARALTCTAARAVDEGCPTVRRTVSETTRFSSEAARDIVDNAVQVMGGIGYTDVYPIERALRDTRLGMIWTGTSEILNLLIQHEYDNQVLDSTYDRRKMEHDAMHPDETERCDTDDDMERVFDDGRGIEPWHTGGVET